MRIYIHAWRKKKKVSKWEHGRNLHFNGKIFTNESKKRSKLFFFSFHLILPVHWGPINEQFCLCTSLSISDSFPNILILLLMLPYVLDTSSPIMDSIDFWPYVLHDRQTHREVKMEISIAIQYVMVRQTLLSIDWKHEVKYKNKMYIKYEMRGETKLLSELWLFFLSFPFFFPFFGCHRNKEKCKKSKVL